jgi:predicted nucleic acid-binding protein
MIVLDSSVLLPALVDRQVGNGALIRELLRRDDEIHAPHLLDLEILQALRRLVWRREVTVEHAVAALEDFVDFPMERYPHSVFIDRIWELRDNITAYDAAYIALAEALGATLLTADKRLAAANGIGCDVEVVG